MGPQTSPSIFIMTRNKTGAFLSMGRIPQLFGHFVLAASMLAGGVSLLNAGGAMANSDTTTIPCTANLGPVGDPGYTYTTANGAGPTVGSGTCTISSPVANSPYFVTMDVKFDPELVGATGGTYSYSLTSVDGHPFIAGLIDSDLDLGTGTVRKEVFAVDESGNPTGVAIFDQISTNGSSSGLIPFGNQSLTEIYVRDTYTIDANSQLDNFTNTFQTPGPLPILGAGAAFGFSRKLRGRIKAARLG